MTLKSPSEAPAVVVDGQDFGDGLAACSGQHCGLIAPGKSKLHSRLFLSCVIKNKLDHQEQLFRSASIFQNEIKVAFRYVLFFFWLFSLSCVLSPLHHDRQQGRE